MFLFNNILYIIKIDRIIIFFPHYSPLNQIVSYDPFNNISYMHRIIMFPSNSII